MASDILCDPYLWENPIIIFSKNPFIAQSSCVSSLTNQAFAVFILFMVLGATISVVAKRCLGLYAGAFIGLAFALPSIIGIMRARSLKENFQGSVVDKVADNVEPSVDVIGSFKYGAETKATNPTARNPFMNVLVDELKYNTGRPAAASVRDPGVKLQLEDFFKTEFFSDPTDVFNRSQSQREFITMPSTSIPNDVDSYQKWLYGLPGKTCKEGGTCLPGTDGAAIPWLNQET